MLMLGEGVLQTIILEVTPDHVQSHVVAFMLTALVLSFLQLINYRYLPYEPKNHAVRKNLTYAIIVAYVTPIFQGGLIFVGVGLKTVLKSHYKLEKEYYTRYAWLYCSSLAITLVLLMYLKFCHEQCKGVYFDEAGNPRSFGPVTRLAYAIKGGSPVLIACLPMLKLDGVTLLATTLTVLISFFVAVRLGLDARIQANEERHDVSFTKDGMLGTIENMTSLLVQLRNTVSAFDERNLTEKSLEEFKLKLIEGTDALHDASEEEEARTLKFLSLYLAEKRKTSNSKEAKAAIAVDEEQLSAETVRD